MFLADSMVQAQQVTASRTERMIDTLADDLGMARFRVQPWYRNLTQAGAIQRLTSPLAKRGALVLISLILKTDLRHRPEEAAYFNRLRLQLRADPVTVPVDVEEHRRLALSCFRE